MDSSALDTEETLAETAYARIREMILTLQLRPGALLSETSLSQQLGIGRTPVRESLKRLKRDRLVDIMPRRGIAVATIGISEQILALEVRRPLERILVARAAKRATGLQRNEFRTLAERLEAAAAAGDLDLYLRIDREYDELIDQVAGNVFASDALLSIHGLTRRFWASMKGTSEWEMVAKLHMRVVRAVATGDQKTAEDASAALMDFNEKVFRTLAN